MHGCKFFPKFVLVLRIKSESLLVFDSGGQGDSVPGLRCIEVHMIIMSCWLGCLLGSMEVPL